MITASLKTYGAFIASGSPLTVSKLTIGAVHHPTEMMATILATGFTGWIADLFTWLMTRLLGFVGLLMSGGVYTFLVFDSPYTDPQYLQAFDHLLGIFPQLLVVVVMAGFASQPFAKNADVDSVVLVWKALKAIIFVAVGRQLMHFGLLLVNAVIAYIYPESYGAFGTEMLKTGMEGAAASAGVVAVGMVILSVTSIAGILLLFAMLVIREFLFVAMFVTLPILAVMLYLDFGPFEDSAKAAKMFINATLSLLFAGIFMAALMYVGATAMGITGSGAATRAAATAGSDPGSFNEVLESFLFWLIGLVAPAIYGLKTAMSSGFVPGRVRSRRKRTSRRRSTASAGQSRESSRASIMKQARFGGRKVRRGMGFVDQRTTGGKVGEKVNSSVNRATSASSGIKGSLGSKAEGTIVEDASRVGKRGAQYTKKSGKRAAKDARSGTNFALRNLDRSPIDWAEAGLEHYRENPVINESHDGVGSKQQTLGEWTDSSTSNYRSK
ncbi:hypothetical protein ACFFQF_30205 [Haladaptatus pallidirubidus]|uniref:Uncharacterized protein n=1 Tax=Haladaptatus pallidirubidus TaxID=1008152 RepID=A0AAV3UI65_9EURY|nr:hypothetical protein [Haladaptatus pallidirubidus]